MTDYELTQNQQQVLNTVPQENLVLVQFIGCNPNGAITAPSPSGLLVDTYGLIGNYGRVRYGTLLYVLKEDAEHTKYFKKSKVKVNLEQQEGGIFQVAAPTRKPAEKKTAVKVNRS